MVSGDPQELHEVDVRRGTEHAPPRAFPLTLVAPLESGDLVVASSSSDEGGQIGLLRSGAETPAWMTPVPEARGYMASHISGWNAWDGRRVLARVGRRVVLYAPFENELSEPIEYVEATECTPHGGGCISYGGDAYGLGAGVWRTESGWLVSWLETELPTSAIGLRALAHDGTPGGPVVRHRDPLGQPGRAHAARRPDGQIAFLYGREDPGCVPEPHSVCGEHVMLLIDEDGAAQGPPRRVHHSQYLPDIVGFVWAGYSYAYAREIIEPRYDGEHWHFDRPGVELQRVCRERM